MRDDPRDASEAKGCSHCDHATPAAGGWCYMFRWQPEFLPCAAYDSPAFRQHLREERAAQPAAMGGDGA